MAKEEKKKTRILRKVNDRQLKLLEKDYQKFWEGVVELDNEAFYKCKKLEGIVVPGTVKRILPKAFSNCPNLKYVAFKDGIQEMNDSPFYETPNVEKIALPSTIKKIPSRFCSHLRKLNQFSRYGSKYGACEYVEEIGDRAFYLCDSLKEAMMYNVKVIGEEAFAYCSSLKSVDFLMRNLKKMGKGCFQGCEALEVVYVSHPLKEIPDYAFADCSRLKNLKIQSTSLELIGREAFRNTGLEKIVIPGSVRKVEHRAFSECKYLKEVEFEEGVEELGFDLFSNSPRIEKIKLPKSLEKINSFNFANHHFKYIYTMKDGSKILSKKEISDKNIIKEYSLVDLTNYIPRFPYYMVIGDESKLDFVFEVVNKCKQEHMRIPGRLFDNYEIFKKFVEEDNLSKLKKYMTGIYDKGYGGSEGENLALLKFGYTIGLFANKSEMVQDMDRLVSVNDMALMLMKEAIRVGYINKLDVVKKYSLKPLSECKYSEKNLKEFAIGLTTYKHDLEKKNVRK